MLATDLAVLDHTDGSILLVANAVNYDDTDERVELAWADAVERLDTMTRALAAPADSTVAVVDTEAVDDAMAQVRSNTTRERYEEVVELAKEDIRAGEVFQVVLSQRFSMECAADPVDVYRALRASNPSPYMYLFRLPHPDGSSYSIVGSSPEALVRVTGERAITHPIAGSRPRGKTPEDDVRLAEELLADPKERSEHVMLVDLGRNDLQRVCRPGTVDVVEFMDVRRYSHVMHIESTVVGDTRPGVSAYDVLVSTFPAGTLSGAPKPRALALIEQYEPSRRGVYGGVVGYLDFHGDLDMAIAIRTAVITRRRRPRAGRCRHRRRLGARPRVRGVRAQGHRGAACGRDRRGDADRHVRRLSAKGVVVLLALVGAGLLLVSAFRPWVTGAVDDAVLGADPDQRHRRRGRPRPERGRPGHRRRGHRDRRGRAHRAGRRGRRVRRCASRSPPPSPCGCCSTPRACSGRSRRRGSAAPARSRPWPTRRSGPGSPCWPARWRCSGWSARSSASAAGVAPRSATRWARAPPAWRPGRAANASRATGTSSAPGRDPTDVGPDAPT